MDFKIARQGGSVIVKIIKFTILSQKHLIFSPKNWSRIVSLWQNLQKSFRLMVGVPDYELSGSHEATSSRFNANGCQDFLSALYRCALSKFGKYEKMSLLN
jgi:hypothetical protein